MWPSAATRRRGRRADRLARRRARRVIGFEPRRLALQRVDCDLVVWRQLGVPVVSSSRLKCSRSSAPMRKASPMRASSAAAVGVSRSRTTSHCAATSASNPSSRMPIVAARRRRSEAPLAPVEQQRAGGLQLLRQRRLLADRRAVSRRQIVLGVVNRGDRPQIDGEFADRFARDQSPRAGVGEDRRQQRQHDVAEAAGGQQTPRRATRPRSSRAGDRARTPSESQPAWRARPPSGRAR